MTEVRVAATAQHLRPPENPAPFVDQRDIALVGWLPEARPARAGVELRPAVEHRLLAANTAVDAIVLRVPVSAGKGALRSLLARHMELLRRKQFAPFRLALFQPSVHRHTDPFRNPVVHQPVSGDRGRQHQDPGQQQRQRDSIPRHASSLLPERHSPADRATSCRIPLHGYTSSVLAPCCSSSARYQRSVWAARSGRATVPHMTDSVRRVSAVVLLRWASLTALAHGPSASNRHSNPPRSIVCPEALKTYDEPCGATPTRSGSRARSRSTTLIGS